MFIYLIIFWVGFDLVRLISTNNKLLDTDIFDLHLSWRSNPKSIL